MELDELLEKIDQKKVPVDRDLLKRAYDFAQLAHADSKRLSGQPIIDHATCVTAILVDSGVYDSQALAAALLHGVLTDTAATQADLEKEFGSELVELVKNVDQVSTIKLTGAVEAKYIENLRKMFLAAASDIRVVLIRLADRLDNLKTIKFLDREKQLRVAKETLEIFAPLAARLGMGEMKGQLEDLAFPVVNPTESAQLLKNAGPKIKLLDRFILKVKAELKMELVKGKISAEIHGRAKHLYSLWLKLSRPEIGGDLTKIYDLMAARIIVGDLEDCYKVLGIVHKLWRPLPGFVRDYIASPKPNGYRSIHTTVFGPGGQLFEIQIRTRRMHQEDEFGIAAHWHYAEKRIGAKDEEVQRGFSTNQKLTWVKQLTDWQKEVTTSDEFLQDLKIDVFANRIFVLTPKGDVKDLPAGATPVDFAYSVHTQLGDRCVGAKVNDKIVPLDFSLHSGDVCEILVSKQDKKPNLDWANFVKTSQARQQIRKAYKD